MKKGALAIASHAGPEPQGESLSPDHALAALASLGQATRLAIFQLLVRSEPGGLAAGLIAEMLKCEQNTLSSHLAVLARSGLVRGTRNGRSIVYRANIEAMKSLIVYLVNDCCDAHPELCGFPAASPSGGNRKRKSAATSRKRR